MNPEMENAILEWCNALGSEYVITGNKLNKYISNLSGEKRKVLAILFPSKTEEVQKIVKIAGKYKIPIYPVSRGRNWGMGSRLPVKDGCVIVELSRLNRIIEVNEKYAYAVIEAGVTQKQLYDYITNKNLPLIMDVTGSGEESSIIGNALDRGVGYFSDRGEEISALTVVLPDGQILKTGYGHYENAKATHLYKHGIGPSIDGLFIQGNFGIVISATINLIHKQESNITFIAKLKDENKLPVFIENIKILKSNGICKSVIHIANRERTRISLTPLIFEELKRRNPEIPDEDAREIALKYFDSEFYGAWSATGRLFGIKGFVKEAKRQIKKILSPVADIMFISDNTIIWLERLGKAFSFIPAIKNKLILLAASKTVYKFTTGIPTNDAVKSVYWPFMSPPDIMDPDNSKCGVIYYLPITPLCGEEVQKLVNITTSILNEDGFEPSITLNTISERSLETVISLPFNRADEAMIAKAHNSINELNQVLNKNGIYVYRAGINLMNDLIKENDPFWLFIKKVKESIDPDHIISPKRYNLI